MSTRADQLARCALFKDFTSTGLEIFASISIERVVPQGTSIFVENMVGDSLFVLTDGYVRISLRDAGAKERTLGVLSEGDYFGELSLLASGSTRLVSAIADTEARVLEIRRKDFIRLQAQKPQACLKLIVAIASAFGEKLGENREVFRSLLLGALSR